MVAPSCTQCLDLVTWTLSGGDYDPDRPVLIDAADTSRVVSKRVATELVARLAGAFQPDSTVCLHLANEITYPVLFLGILASKCRWTGTNTAYTAHELGHHFRLSKTKYVVTQVQHLEVVSEAIDKAGDGAEIILFSDILRERPEPACLQNGLAVKHPCGLRTLHDLLRPPEKAFDLASLRIDVDSVASLATTSGTTGLPKMAARTHKAMVLESFAIEDTDAAKPYPIRRLFCTPIFHAFSSAQMLIGSLRYGHLSYFMRRFDDVAYPQYVHDFCITETVAPPPMILKFVHSDRATQEKLSSLRLIWSGGAALAEDLRRKAIAMFRHDIRIVQVWGMTEGGWFATFKYPEDDCTGSVGRMIPGYEIKLNNRRASELSNGKVAGELVVKSAHLMTLYLGNEKATVDAFTDGWLNTGDMGYLEDGKVYLVDRLKELIKVNGWQVAPAEIEAALLQSPDVLDAAVIGVGHDINEHPLAFVVRARSDVGEKSIKESLLGRLTRYKVQSCEVKFVEKIPKSISGKILKTVLRKQHEAGEGRGDCENC